MIRTLRELFEALPDRAVDQGELPVMVVDDLHFDAKHIDDVRLEDGVWHIVVAPSRSKLGRLLHVRRL